MLWKYFSWLFWSPWELFAKTPEGKNRVRSFMAGFGISYIFMISQRYNRLLKKYGLLSSGISMSVTACPVDKEEE
jgi:hypothetical protein